ncbi:MAG: FHA domain-containing protein [Acidimicrobiales bacterium]
MFRCYSRAYLTTPAGEQFPIESDAVTIGRDIDSDLVVGDPMVSALHAVVRRYHGGWSVQDVGSRNGTFVNGQRVAGEHRLRSGDEIGVGNTRLRFRADATSTAPTTTAGDPPELTPAEHRVLVELCRPLLSGDHFPQPASVADIAGALVVGEETVKWHLKNLARKFAIDEGGGSRRIALANEAMRRRAVSLAELQSPRQ